MYTTAPSVRDTCTIRRYLLVFNFAHRRQNLYNRLLRPGREQTAQGSEARMASPLLAALAQVSPGSTATTQIIIRWIHLVAGITWIGLLYFFTLVSNPVMKQMDAGTRAR